MQMIEFEVIGRLQEGHVLDTLATVRLSSVLISPGAAAVAEASFRRAFSP